MTESNPVAVRHMPWEDLRRLIRSRSVEIGTLAGRGDALAIRLMAAYRDLYDHPGDLDKGATLRAALEDYMNRDLRIKEVQELGDRFGHRLPQPEPVHGPRIFVPGPKGKQ